MPDSTNVKFKSWKARLYQAKETDEAPTKMWVFDCPCEARPLRYWGFGAAYGTMLWHFHLYHRKTRS